jgi:hypothetical protein
MPTAPASTAGTIVRATRRVILATILAAAGVVVAATPSAAAPTGYVYVVTGRVNETHRATGADGDVGLCSTPETAQYKGTFIVHLRTTRAGLSNQDVLALMEAEPDDTLLNASYREVGALVQRSGVHTYSMRYHTVRTAQMRGGRVTLRSFTAHGTSELRTRYSIRSSGVLVLVNGEPTTTRERLRVLGCL